MKRRSPPPAPSLLGDRLASGPARQRRPATRRSCAACRPDRSRSCSPRSARSSPAATTAPRPRGSSALGRLPVPRHHLGRLRRLHPRQRRPTDVQDAKAAELVHSILDRHGSDVTAVPVVWYIGHVPEPRLTEWDTVPVPERRQPPHPTPVPGHVAHRLPTTPRRRQRHREHHVDDAPPPLASRLHRQERSRRSTAAGRCPDPERSSTPTRRRSTTPTTTTPPGTGSSPTGTPIYAVRGGTVATVRTWPYNWWTARLRRRRRRLRHLRHRRHHPRRRRHPLDLLPRQRPHVNLGDTVAAGQQILWSGNTGRSGAPHLHLELLVEGARRCPQPLLASLYGNTVAIGSGTLPRVGCTF